MPLPVLLATTRSRALRRKLAEDLLAHYGKRVHVLVVAPARAERALARLARRPEALAVFVHGRADDRLATRVEREFPDAGRALLLVGDGDPPLADASIVVPYGDPSEGLYPPLDDLVDSYLACLPAGDGVRLIGPRWSSEVYETKAFLRRNGVAYEWDDQETEPAARLADGRRIPLADREALAVGVGLQVDPKRRAYDLAIVGGGPAGLAAAVYAASEGLSTVVIEKDAPGGQAGYSASIENYLGFPDGLSGDDLARRAVAQCRKFGVEIVAPATAERLVVAHGRKTLTLADGAELSAPTVLIATGVEWRRLNVPGEERLYGRGVYYGSASSEAVLCEDEDVAVVGGANSAGQAALHLARFAKRVTMIVRGGDLRETMSDYLRERIEAMGERIDVRPHLVIEEVCGEAHLEAVRVRDGDVLSTVPMNGLFVYIGAEPHTDWLADTLARDEDGFLLTGEAAHAARGGCRWRSRRAPMTFETCLAGVFAAGDVRSGSLKRVASAVGQGSSVVSMVHEYLQGPAA